MMILYDTAIHIVRETYENLGSKSLPRNSFTSVFIKVCHNMYKNIEIQLPGETPKKHHQSWGTDNRY